MSPDLLPSSFPLLPSHSEEWDAPAGLSRDGIRVLTLRQIADGAAEAPLSELGPQDRARLVGARLENAGCRRARSSEAVEWIALGFIRDSAARPPAESSSAAEAPSSRPLGEPLRLGASGTTGIVAADARWDAFSRAAGAWRREHLYPALAAPVLVPWAGRLSRQSLHAALRAPHGTPGGPFRPKDGTPGGPSLPEDETPGGTFRPTILTASGHGRADGFFGDAFELLLSADPHRPRLPAELRGCVVHLLACRCASKLGPALLAAGAAGFIGYDDDFVFDEDAPDLFFECDSEIVRRLAAGHSAEAAVAAARRKMVEAVTGLRAEMEPYRAAMLQYNLEHLVEIRGSQGSTPPNQES